MSGAETTGARAGDGIAVTGEREAFEAWAGAYHGLEDDHGYVNLRYLGLHKQYVDFDVQRAWEAWKASAARAAAPAERNVPAGWKLVPENPTAEMIKAGRELSGEPVYQGSEVAEIYRDMLAAAPSALLSTPAVRYTSAMGAAADAYINKLGGRSSTLPAQFRWEECLAAMLAAAPAAAPAQIPEDEISNPYRMSRGAAKIWLNGFRAGERAHGIQAPATADGSKS